MIPSLVQKKDNSLLITEDTLRLFQVVHHEQNKEDKVNDDEAKIRVSELISKMAFYYEKIRNSFDYEEDYLLRKNAIKRIIKRQIVIEGVLQIKNEADEVAKHLMLELIRAGYLPNNEIPETVIDDITFILEKYIKLRNNIIEEIDWSSHIKSVNVVRARDALQEQNRISNWLISIMACEIEETLGEDQIKETVINNMYDSLTADIKLPRDMESYKDDLDVQIYLGIYRNFMKYDTEMQSFILFKYFNAHWDKARDEDINKIAKNIYKLQDAINEQLEHSLHRQLNKIINRYTVYFSILEDVITQDPDRAYNNISDDDAFALLIKEACKIKYQKIKIKLRRAAIRSIIYILLSKSIFVLLFEIPVIKFFGGQDEIIPLIINVSFPAFLLFLVSVFTKSPGEDNTNKIIKGIKEVVYRAYKKDPFFLRQPTERGKVISFILGFIYSATFFLSFGLVIWGLDKVGFHWVSIVVFLFFLAFVSFFSIRIRKGTREIIVIETKENIVKFLVDFFYIPIIVVGKYLSEKFSRFSPFIFILDFIIESPFKIIVQITEEWTKYVKEKKEEVN